MPLVADLRPGEVMLINGARLQCARRVSWCVSTSDTRILFGRMVIDREHLSTPLLKLYFAIQQAYAGTMGEEREKWERELPLYIHEVKMQTTDKSEAEVLGEVEKHLADKHMYKALRCIFLRYSKTDEFPSVR